MKSLEQFKSTREQEQNGAPQHESPLANAAENSINTLHQTTEHIPAEHTSSHEIAAQATEDIHNTVETVRILTDTTQEDPANLVSIHEDTLATIGAEHATHEEHGDTHGHDEHDHGHPPIKNALGKSLLTGTAMAGALIKNIPGLGAVGAGMKYGAVALEAMTKTVENIQDKQGIAEHFKTFLENGAAALGLMNSLEVVSALKEDIAKLTGPEKAKAEAGANAAIENALAQLTQGANPEKLSRTREALSKVDWVKAGFAATEVAAIIAAATIGGPAAAVLGGIALAGNMREKLSHLEHNLHATTAEEKKKWSYKALSKIPKIVNAVKNFSGFDEDRISQRRTQFSEYNRSAGERQVGADLAAA